MSHELQSESDKALVASILSGKIQDFAIVVQSTERLVTQIVRRMVSNEEDQKDLVQDIYVKVYQHLSSFQFKSKLSTWIANVAYHTTLNHLQKKKIPVAPLETMTDEPFVTRENGESDILKAETSEILATAIQWLPPLYRTLITLYHLEELPNKEIAAITNLPEGTIKSYLSRARKLLKDSLLHHYKINRHDPSTSD